VAGADANAGTAKLVEGRRVFELLRRALPPSRAAKLAADITGASRKLLYDAAKEE